ncbi:MAG TPA: hypothetical protein VM008_14430 [Phycisphaerae bacterium]|nr:hypothetical protein [Phycisphaerae bacterium]
MGDTGSAVRIERDLQGELVEKGLSELLDPAKMVGASGAPGTSEGR